MSGNKTEAKSDLNGYTDYNFLSPKVFTGPTDEILQKKVDFNNKNFGSTTEKLQLDTTPIGWIKNMTLRIELAALTTISNDTGYINWVDSIGHAIIESINLKLGNTVLFDSIFPYGLWLDIYNELNDPNMLEWSMIGKHSSIDGLRKYETNKKVLYVPLHLWFSESLDSALPYFLFPNKESGLQISIQLRRFKDLVLLSSGNNLPTTPEITKLQLIYDIIQVPDNKLASLKDQYRKIPYQIYFNHKDFYEQSLNSIVNLNFEDAPISKLIFVIRNNSRMTSDDTPQINEHYSDTNGNDIFNYGNTSLITELGTYDNFNILNINTKNETDDHNLDSIYYRKVTNMNNGKHVPQKHIYTVPFDYGTKGNSFLGFLDYKNQDTLQFVFEDNASNSTISSFALTYNKLEIDRNGRTNLNNWYNNKLQTSSISGSIGGGGGGGGGGLSEDALYKKIYKRLYKEIFEKISSQITLPTLPICETIPTGTTIGRQTYMNNNKLFIVLNQNETNWTVLMPNIENLDKYVGEYVVFKEQDESQVYRITQIIKQTDVDKDMINKFILALLISKSGSSKFIDIFFLELLGKYKLHEENLEPLDTLLKGLSDIFKNPKYANNPDLEIFNNLELEEGVRESDKKKKTRITAILKNDFCYESIIDTSTSPQNPDTTPNPNNSKSYEKIIMPLMSSYTNLSQVQQTHMITVEKMDSLVNLVGSTTKSTQNQKITNETINEYIRLRTTKRTDYNEADKNNPALFKVDNFLRNSFLYVENKLSIETKLAQLKQIELNQGNIGPTRSPFTLSPKSQNYITLIFILDNYEFKGIPSFSETCNDIDKKSGYNPKLVKQLYKGSTINYLALIKDFIEIYKKIYLEHSQYEGYKKCRESLKNLILQNIQNQIKDLRTFVNSKGTTTTPTGTTPAPPLIPKIVLSNTTEIQLNILDQPLDEWLNSNMEEYLYVDKNENNDFSVSTIKPIITTTTTTSAPFTTDTPYTYNWFPTPT
jgi:hypothetical protein